MTAPRCTSRSTRRIVVTRQDRSAAAGRKTYQAPRKRGYSKNGRTDAPQIVVGLAVRRDGFPGNTVDVTTVRKVKAELRDCQLTRCLFVGDAGMVSQENFRALAKGSGKFLMAMPLRRGDEVSEAVLTRSGRHRQVAENLQVKEVVIGEGDPDHQIQLLSGVIHRVMPGVIVESIENRVLNLAGGLYVGSVGSVVELFCINHHG